MGQSKSTSLCMRLEGVEADGDLKVLVRSILASRKKRAEGIALRIYSREGESSLVVNSLKNMGSPLLYVIHADLSSIEVGHAHN